MYRFPTGNLTLHITEDEFGNVTVNIRSRTTPRSVPYSYGERHVTFESERDWFVSVDQYQRLWIFHGHWDPAWGELRQMPSGGFIPYAPAVIMKGLRFLTSGGLAGGGEVVTATGNWAGIPPEFLDRIPDRHSAQWGNVPPIPKTAPELSPQQHSEILRRLRTAITQFRRI